MLHAMEESSDAEEEAYDSDECLEAELVMEERELDYDRLFAMQTSMGPMGERSGAVTDMAAMVSDKLAALECYNCHEYGHVGRKCPKPRTAEYTEFLDKAARARETQQRERPASAAAGSERRRVFPSRQAPRNGSRPPRARGGV
jgi:hypothetical protein